MRARRAGAPGVDDTMHAWKRAFQRRTFLKAGAGLVAAALGHTAGAAAQGPSTGSTSGTTRRGERPVPGTAGTAAVPVVAPDLARLPFELDGGVKVFRLVAEVVEQEVLPGRVFHLWGYNGSAPGPTIEVHEGDRVRVLFENRLPEPTTVHWHGLEVPIEMDGVPAISQPDVPPGGRFTYEFTLHQHGTFFYHSHGAMQEMMGMLGLFIVHPRETYTPLVQKDFALVLQEYGVLPSNTIPNSLSMEFNWLTFNGKAAPATTPMIVKLGERVRLRLVNIGMDHHPIHLHGMQFEVTGTEGGRIPPALWYPQNTVLVGVAQARVVEFEAKFPGDWMLHCHLPHHMMNQMVSMVGPMAHAGHGLQTGGGMEEGMGMVRKGHALSEDLGPKLGRGMGMAEAERPVSAMVGQPGHGTHGQHGGAAGVPKKRVPGFPQDMFMPMDDEVAKPETWGMAKNWTGATQGMMTIVRVLPPEKYDEIMRRVEEARQAPPGPARIPAPAGAGDGTRGHRH
jgi:FtsP/CotA-like multicopper oxidase with cupredoxin domain